MCETSVVIDHFMLKILNLVKILVKGDITVRVVLLLKCKVKYNAPLGNYKLHW